MSQKAQSRGISFIILTLCLNSWNHCRTNDWCFFYEFSRLEFIRSQLPQHHDLHRGTTSIFLYTAIGDACVPIKFRIQ